VASRVSLTLLELLNVVGVVVQRTVQEKVGSKEPSSKGGVISHSYCFLLLIGMYRIELAMKKMRLA
jgi:hypothetical protein